VAHRQLSNGNPDGETLGLSTTDKIAFYGVTPIVQRSGAAQVALTDSSGGAAADTIAAIGGTYSQTEVANAIASLASKTNELRAALVALGLIKGAA
jgi:hypothetical protein